MKILLVLLIVLSLPLTTVKADETINIDDALSSVLEGIDERDFEFITNEINSLFGENKTLKEWIINFITGEISFENGNFLSKIFSQTSSVLSNVASVMAYVLFIGISCSLSNIIISKNADKNEKSIIYFISQCIIITLCSTMISGLFETAINSLYNITKTLEITFPVMVTLSEFSGGFGVGLYKPMISVVSLIVGAVSTGVLTPILSASTICTISGNLTDTVKLDGLRKTLLSSVKWIIGVIGIVFTVCINALGIVNMQYNGISFKILKYATGSLIPIVGGFISGGLDVVLSSAVLVKNSFGLISAFYIFLSVGSSAITILLSSFIIKFFVSVAEPILDRRFMALITGLGDILSHLTAVLMLCTFSFIMVCFSLISSTALVI